MRTLLGIAVLALAGLAAAPARAAEIVVWHAYRAGEKSALEKVAAAYNSSHPSTKVSTLAVPYDAFADKISVGAISPRTLAAIAPAKPQQQLRTKIEEFIETKSACTYQKVYPPEPMPHFGFG